MTSATSKPITRPKNSGSSDSRPNRRRPASATTNTPHEPQPRPRHKEVMDREAFVQNNSNNTKSASARRNPNSGSQHRKQDNSNDKKSRGPRDNQSRIQECKSDSFSGGSFHSSPNASSLPKPSFNGSKPMMQQQPQQQFHPMAAQMHPGMLPYPTYQMNPLHQPVQHPYMPMFPTYPFINGFNGIPMMQGYTIPPQAMPVPTTPASRSAPN